MRLGKEQAVGYVEDTETDSLPVPEVVAGETDGMPVTGFGPGALEPSLTVN
jgi:hypothetical protein